MKISIVTTLYRSAPFLSEFYSRIMYSAQNLGLPYELIMVNDGSPDHSLDVALSIQQQDPNVKVIDLSRNFGHHKAILTGLSVARGDLVFLIDCDLEEDPELLERFYSLWEEQKESIDVFYGMQENRSGTFYKRIAGALFYKIFNYFSSVKISESICTVRLMTKRYVDSLLEYKDKNVFLAALFEMVGYKQMPVTINKPYKGSSSYNFLRKIALMTEAITSFSSKPLTMIMLTGVAISSASFLFALYLVFRKLFSSSIISGWTSLMVSVWFLGGVILFSLGVLGVYITKIYNETKDRPISIIRAVYGKESRDTEDE